jgi:hypothetical protein
MPTLCHHCGDTLPDDAPADVTSCRSYSEWLARQGRDTLTENHPSGMTLLVHFCDLSAVLRDVLEFLSALE